MKCLATALMIVIALTSCGAEDATDGDIEAPCAAPGAKGNSIGVGEYCTRGGHECADNLEAFLCIVDIRPDAEPFCVKSCSTDEGCGENAVCTNEGGEGPKGCVPACILE